ALCRAALDLAFHVTGMDRLARILHGGVTQDRHFPGLWIDFDIDDMRRKSPADAGRIDAGATNDCAARIVELAGQLLECESPCVATILEYAVLIDHIVRGNLPEFRGTDHHLTLDVLRRFVGRPAG